MLRRITIAYTINELGNWVGAVALTVAVFDHTRSAIAITALFVSVRFVPAVAVTPVVAWLESGGRRRVLATLYGVQALTTAGLAVLVLRPMLAPILVLGAADGLAALAAKALLRAVVSQESRDDEGRRRANAVLNSCWAATFAIGPAAGGFLSGTLGPSAALLLDVASFAFTAALLTDVPTARATGGGRRIIEQLGAVVGHVRANRALGWLLGTEAVAVVFFAAVVPVEIVFVKGSLHAGASGYGALLAAWGTGTVAGSAIFARVRRRSLGALITVSTLGVAVAYLGIAGSTAIATACAFSLIGGIGNGIQWIALITAVQEQTPSDLHGRLMAVLESMGALCPAVGFSLGGAIAALADPRATFIVAGVAAAIATCAFALLLRRGLVGRGLAVGPPTASRAG
jgi:MFS family permease